MEVLAVVAAVLVMYFTYGLIFGCWDELAEALGFWLTPDVFSWVRGEGMEDFLAEMKLGFWILSGVATYWGITNIFS